MESEIHDPSSLRVTHGIILPRDTVMREVKDVDPEGTEIRKARRLRRRRCISLGPNFSWHINEYYKLKNLMAFQYYLLSDCLGGPFGNKWTDGGRFFSEWTS